MSVLSEPLATAGARAGTRHQGRRRLSPTVIAIQVGALCLLFGSWELVARQGWLNPAFVSEPSQYFPSFWHGISQGNLLSLMGTTLYETFVGFSIAAVLGMAAGYLMAEFRIVDTVARPFMTGFNNLPRIALAPLFVLWFGLGSTSRIALVVSLGFFIMAFSTYAGLQSTSRDHLLLGRTLGTGRWARFWKFELPSAMPAIFGGLQLNLSYAFLGAVVGEMFTGSAGLGGYLALQLNTFDTSDFFGAIVLLIIVAVALSGLLRATERRLLRWRTVELAGTKT